MKQKDQLTQYVYMALYTALYVVMKKYVSDLIPFLQMQNGGSIEIELIILFVASYHLGWKKGILTGLLSWGITFLMGSGRYFVDPFQYLLDYILPLVAIGFASKYWKRNAKGYYYITIIVAMVMKWLCNVLSGVYFWMPSGEAAGSKGAWIYSLGYNTPYNVVTMIVCLLIVPVLVSRLKKTNTEFVA